VAFQEWEGTRPKDGVNSHIEDVGCVIVLSWDGWGAGSTEDSRLDVTLSLANRG